MGTTINANNIEALFDLLVQELICELLHSHVKTTRIFVAIGIERHHS